MGIKTGNRADLDRTTLSAASMEGTHMDSGWMKLKQGLVKKGALSDFFILRETIDWAEIEPERFEPLLISKHLDSVSELIQRCFSIRKEIRDLEILAVKSAVDYDLFLKTAEIDEEMEKLGLLKESKEKEKKGHENAAAAFGNGTSSTDRGLGAVSNGRAAALAEDLATTQRLTTRIEDRWRQVSTYQTEYQERFKTEGNAHNYGERAKNLFKIFEEEIKEAAGRAVALKSGLKSIYDWDTNPLPSEINLSSLDDFVLWVLAVRRGCSLRSEQETSYDVVVPLVQPWLPGGRSLMDSAEFDRAMGKASDDPIVLRFIVEKDVFFGEQVRLKGCGLAFGNVFKMILASGVDSVQTADSFARLAVKIQTPPQRSPDGRMYKRSPLTFGNVCLHHPEHPAAFTQGPDVENINPLGPWEIRLHPWVVWKDGKAAKVRDGMQGERIRDLKLVFRAYVPSRPELIGVSNRGMSDAPRKESTG